MKRFILRALPVLLGAAAMPLVSACGTAAGGETALAAAKAAPQPTQRPQATAKAEPVDEAVPTEADLSAWKARFRTRALAAGIGSEVFDRAMRDVRVNARVVELDRYQPEFTRPIWEYLDSAASETRISTGRTKAALHEDLLARIEKTYGVDSEIVLAIWGLESAYGFNTGTIPVPESLATLAVDGRREAFAEEQLIAALKIIQSGDVAPERMVGSWAGAMGHTQFIPTSFQAYAVDFTGDGRRDVWAEDPADALASTANYLSRFGWALGAPVVVEVRLPAGFDYTLADDAIRKTAAAWQALGVTAIDGRALPAGDGIAILAPAGARGPAFAAYPNFRVIKRYNNATSYALAVAHLAERIGGGDPFVQAWPRTDRPLARTEKMELQRRLSALGFSTGGIDGIVGPNTRGAVRAFQKSQGLTPDGYISEALLERVRRAG